MFAALPLSPFRVFSAGAGDPADPSSELAVAPETTVFAELESAREDTLRACRRVADLQARLDDAGTAVGSDSEPAVIRALGPNAYRAILVGGGLLAAAAAYSLVAGIVPVEPWIALSAAVAIGGHAALGGSQLGERIRELPTRWNRRPGDRRLVFGLAMPGAMLAAVGAVLLTAPSSPAAFAVLAVVVALGTAGWLAADPDPDHAALITDLETARNTRDRLCRRYALRLAAARSAVLEKIDSLSLPEDNAQGSAPA